MKNYLKEIIKLRKGAPTKDNNLIVQAYNFAREKHKGQKFDGYEHPYFIHPAYAGFLLAKWRRGYEEICAGLLHDVVEDCEVSLATIRRIFGPRIAFLVDGMSWEIKWNAKTKSWYKDRPGFYKKIMDYSKQDIGVVIIHAADEISKLSDILNKKLPKKDESLEKSAKRHAWTAKIMVPFYKEVGLAYVSDKVWNKISDFIGKKPKSELNKYISKKELNILREKIKKTGGIDSLR